MLIGIIIILYILLLLVITSENIILTLNPDEIRKIRREQNFLIRWLNNLLENPKYLASFFSLKRVFLSVSVIILSFYLLMNYLNIYGESVRFIISFFAVFILFILFSYTLPSLMSKSPSVNKLKPILPFLWICYKLFFPFYYLWSNIQAISIGAQSYAGIMGRAEGYFKTSDEPNSDSDFKEETMNIMRNIFEFNETMVKEIMIPRIDMTSVALDMPVPKIIEIIKKTGHSRLPVYRDSFDDIVGILYAKDLLTESSSSSEIEIEKLLRDAYFIPETKRVSQLFQELKNKRLHMAIVVDEYGGTAGLITMEDLLEEIVGEIEDEYDKKEELLKKIDDNTFIVLGKIPIADVNEELNLNLPEDDADTIGGLIFKLKGGIPRSGESFRHKNYTFNVLETRGHRVIRVKITKPDNSES